jgi:hypothetical protein
MSKKTRRRKAAKGKARSSPAAMQPGRSAASPVLIWDFSKEALPANTELTREAAGWYFDSSLALTTARCNAPRFAYDPAGTGLQGLLVEAAATNYIRNAAAAGAGAPSTLPINWAADSSPKNGITREIISSGTEDGIPYLDIRHSGTPNATQNIWTTFDQDVAAVDGQCWTLSCFVRVVGGSLTNVEAVYFEIVERSSSRLALAGSAQRVTPTSAALKTQRISLQRTFNQARVALSSPALRVAFADALAIDLTLRIGLPQLIHAPSATSPIITTSAAVSRPADVLGLALPDGTYAIDILRASGKTTIPIQTVTEGRWTVPPDISPLQRVVATRIS